ncbi:hypothetical protein SOASR032_13380 [Pragia fontium]|uniref:Autotransporter domain-containing protein n=1 Tax=Pragia fontium TaxID=82985 RepID=A0ABQ5LGT7_9GAMM|nr:autotransporter domain-containing protein [Pragia fontium]GKX62769.1 hypothetical protein SOASR032_13380 [Pragia fontium]
MLSSSAIFRFSSLKSVIFLSLFLSPALSAQDYSFEQIVLSDKEYAYSRIYQLSRDGSTVIGVRADKYFIWTSGGSMIDVLESESGYDSANFYGVSANGSVVVGSVRNIVSQNYEAFRWTAEKGRQSLGFLAPIGSKQGSSADAVSQNGQVVVGASFNADGRIEAFRWTENSGMQGLVMPSTDQYEVYSSRALVTNYNGDTVLGYLDRSDNASEAFIWTESEGIQGLGFIDGGGDSNTYRYSSAVHLSDDGLVVGGESTNANNEIEAFRWTREQGIQGLGFIDGGGRRPTSAIEGMSSDGAVMIGTSTVPTDDIHELHGQAFRWTAETGMVGLGYLGIGNIHPESGAWQISADGSTILGASTTANDELGLFIWRHETGMFNLLEAMAASGIDLSGWKWGKISSISQKFPNLTGISANGEIIAGFGINPDNLMESWLIRIPKPQLKPELPPAKPEKPDPGPEGKPQPPVIPPITPPASFLSARELHRSLSDMTSVPMSGLSVAQGALQDQRFISAEQCASDKVSDKRYCTFITGTGAFWRGDGTQGRGSAGMAVRLSPSLSLGMSAYLGNQHYDLRLSGKNKMNSYGGALFLNYSEGKQGLRAFGAVTASHLDYDLRRHYRNGSYNISRSSGESSGRAIGGMVRLGWAFSPQDRISAIPFAELSWAKATIKGYREHSGTFPIDFDSRKANETDMRLGSELRYDLTDAVNINGGIAWVHRLSGELDRVSGTVIGWSETSVSAAKLPTNWSEVSLGASYKLTADMNLSASTTSTIGRSHQPDTSVRAGFSMSF